MSIRVECPHCRADFRVDDRLAGEQGRCPSCLNTVLVPSVPSGPAIPPMPSLEERDRYSQRDRYDNDDYRSTARYAPSRGYNERNDYRDFAEQSTPETWRKIRSGLGMILLAAGLYLFGQLLWLVFVMVKGTEEGLDKNAQMESGDLAIAIGGGVLSAIAYFLLMAGRKKCLAYPDTASKVSIYTSFVCSAGTAFSFLFGATGFIIGILIIQQRGPADPLAGVFVLGGFLLLGLSALTAIIQEIAWPFFLIGLAKGIQTARAKTWARINLFGLFAVFAATFLIFIILCGYSMTVVADHKKKVDAQKQKQAQDLPKPEKDEEKKGLGKLPKKEKEDDNKADRPKVEGEEPEVPLPPQPEPDHRVMMSFQLAFLGVIVAYMILFMCAASVMRSEIARLIPEDGIDEGMNRRDEY